MSFSNQDCSNINTVISWILGDENQGRAGMPQEDPPGNGAVLQALFELASRSNKKIMAGWRPNEVVSRWNKTRRVGVLNEATNGIPPKVSKHIIRMRLRR